MDTETYKRKVKNDFLDRYGVWLAVGTAVLCVGVVVYLMFAFEDANRPGRRGQRHTESGSVVESTAEPGQAVGRSADHQSRPVARTSSSSDRDKRVKDLLEMLQGKWETGDFPDDPSVLIRKSLTFSAEKVEVTIQYTNPILRREGDDREGTYSYEYDVSLDAEDKDRERQAYLSLGDTLYALEFGKLDFRKLDFSKLDTDAKDFDVQEFGRFGDTITLSPVDPRNLRMSIGGFRDGHSDKRNAFGTYRRVKADTKE